MCTACVWHWESGARPRHAYIQTYIHTYTHAHSLWMALRVCDKTKTCIHTYIHTHTCTQLVDGIESLRQDQERAEYRKRDADRKRREFKRNARYLIRMYVCICMCVYIYMHVRNQILCLYAYVYMCMYVCIMQVCAWIERAWYRKGGADRKQREFKRNARYSHSHNDCLFCSTKKNYVDTECWEQRPNPCVLAPES